MMFSLDDQIAFYCGGRGRGGHVVAHCKITKINRKTIVLEEVSNSYMPGQQWRCNPEWLRDNLTPKGMTIPDYNINF